MKKFTLCFLMFLALASTVWALPDWVQQSATKTADAAISTTPGYFHGIVVTTDATNACTVKIYDNKSAASGDKLIPDWIVTTSATDRAQSYSISPPVRYGQGIYVDITTDGACSYMVYFNNR